MMATLSHRHSANLAERHAASRSCCVIHIEPLHRALLVALVDSSQAHFTLRVTHADDPALDALSSTDRAIVRSAFLTLLKENNNEV